MSLLVLSVLASFLTAADAPASGSSSATSDGTVETVQPTPDQVKTAEQSAEANRIVCRRHMVVGSHRPKKLCLTKAEWKEWEDLNKDKLNTQTLQDPAPGVDKFDPTSN